MTSGLFDEGGEQGVQLLCGRRLQHCRFERPEHLFEVLMLRIEFPVVEQNDAGHGCAMCNPIATGHTRDDAEFLNPSM
jgi:hypothetical protein